jgi:hypothetical protein
MEALNIFSEEEVLMVSVNPQLCTITFRDTNGHLRAFDLMELRELVCKWLSRTDPIR